MFNKTKDGSSARLLQLCVSYFIFYVITGITVKYFTGNPASGFPGLSQTEYLVYSTIGGNLICLLIVVLFRWYHLKSNKIIRFCGIGFPQEYLYIIPSGVCTAIVIPTTTLMYTLPISVMVAMVIMRASVIIISRVVDAIQIKQNILKKKVYPEENIAVLFALLAAGVNIFWTGEVDFDFIESVPAMAILTSYIAAYSIRIYIMNYYKNTREHGVPLDNKGFFAIEQISATTVLLAAGITIFNFPSWFGIDSGQLGIFRSSLTDLRPAWLQAVLAGTAFGMVAFFSVFIFMFKGRTATFAGLVNRLTSLIAGTTATLVFAILYGGKYPEDHDWLSLVFILLAVVFLTTAERKRKAELTV